MTNFITSLRLPDVVYHGTTMGAIAGGLKTKLINFEYLRESRNRDFGTGFYTTIDLKQAMTWPVGKLIRKIESGAETITTNEIPAVAKIRIYPERYDDDISVKDFRGESFDWVKFVLNHRYDSSLDRCLCDQRGDMPHPQIVCGSMADNDTGDVIAEFNQSGKSLDDEEHIRWFGRNITRSKDGKRLLGLELGDQIAFFDERLNRIIQFEGYYKLNLATFTGKINNSSSYKKEWDFYDQHDRKSHDE